MGVAPLLCVSVGRSSCKGDGRAKHAPNSDVSGAFRCSRILKLSSLRFQHGCMGPSQSPAVRSEHLRGKMKIFGKKHFISSLSYCLLAPCQSMCSMLAVAAMYLWLGRALAFTVQSCCIILCSVDPSEAVCRSARGNTASS